MIEKINKFYITVKRFIGLKVIEGIPDLLFYIYSLILYPKLERIHVIGDSHTGTFRFNKHFIVHHIGPVTAYNLVSKKSTTNSRKKLFTIIEKLRANTKILLVAGEIDCRIHVFYQYMKNNCKDSIGEIVSKTITRYLNAAKELRDMGMDVYICSIAPVNNQKNRYQYPYYGDVEQQKEIKIQFNLLLEEVCKKNGFGYVDIFSHIIDSNGFIKKEYTEDEIHCTRKAVIFAEDYFNIHRK